MKTEAENPKQKGKKNKRNKIIGLIVAAALLIGGWQLYSGRRVAMTKVLKGSAIDSVYATGVIDTPYIVQLSFKKGGHILKLNAKEGDIVKKGQVLAELDSEDAQSYVTEQDARVAYQKADYDRASNLYNKKVGSLQDMQKTAADYNAGKALLTALKKNLDDLYLKSPDTCRVISGDDLKIGSYVSVSNTIFYLDCSGELRITAEVDEENMVHVKVGQKVYFKYDGLKGQTFEGNVSQITPMGDSATRYFRVRISIPHDTPLMIGMTVEVNILLDKKDNTLLIPTSALSGGQDRVWKVEKNKLVEAKVETGMKGDRQTEIKGGLKQGDEIVKEPQPWFKEGKWVSPVLEETKKKNGR